MLVLVLGVTGRATGLLDILPHHRHDGVVRQPALARTVIVQNVTKPKLALLHQNTPAGTTTSDGATLAGKGRAKGVGILAEPVRASQ
jgi:hypothetical protein